MKKTYFNLFVLSLLLVIMSINLYAENEFLVNTTTSYDQSRPTVAMDEQGNFVVVWLMATTDETHTNIAGQKFDISEEKIGNEFQINSGLLGCISRPSVAMDNDGNFVVTWDVGIADEDNDVYAQLFDASANKKGSEFIVNTYTDNRQERPYVAMDADGDFIIVWMSRNQDGDNWGIYAQRYDENGNKVGDEFIVNDITKRWQRYPCVAMDNDGNFIIVWENTAEDVSGNISYQRYGWDGTKFWEESTINDHEFNTQTQPAVALIKGEFVACWDHYKMDSDDDDVYAKKCFDADGTNTGDIVVNTYLQSDQHLSRVAMAEDGNFVIVWQSNGQEQDNDDIYAQIFKNDGTKIQSEFRVNDHDDDDQSLPCIAMKDSENFVVVWESNNQVDSTSGDDIYAKVYRNMVPQPTPTQTPSGTPVITPTPSATPVDAILIGISLNPKKSSYTKGDNFNLIFDIQGSSKDTYIDLYFVMLSITKNQLYFGLLWDMVPAAVITNFRLPANFVLFDIPILSITIPCIKPPIRDAAGTYAFAIGAAKPGTAEFISNIAIASFEVK
jgi:hypothetical protein